MASELDMLLNEIKPTSKARVYDLVAQAGFDVNDWAKFAGGEKKAAANPKYCYEWSFTESDRLVLLNLWHDSFKSWNQEIICELNMRAFANEVARAADDPWRENRPPKVWERRAQKLDQSIQLAYRKKLPIRVIICEGEMHDFTLGDEEASKVKKRMLDPTSWYVQSYDWNNGQAILIRRARPEEQEQQPHINSTTEDMKLSPAELKRDNAVNSIITDDPEFIDQFTEELFSTKTPDLKRIESFVFVRSPEVRGQALKRANGACQLCGQSGFLTAIGKVYLETHHVIPLSEGGDDTLSNVVALCANDHKRAHFSADRTHLRNQLLEIASRSLLA